MRLDEILTPLRNLVATDRFRDSYNAFRQVYRNLDGVLRAFIEFRLTHRPDEPFGVKDSPFAGSLHGFRHYHMVHGRVILVYQITHAELRLSLVTDHSYSEHNRRDQMVQHLRSMTYEPLRVGAGVPALDAAQIKAIKDLFFEFAAEDRDGLRAALADPTDLMAYIRAVLEVPWSDTQKDQATLAAFDGLGGLRTAIQQVLRQTTIRQAM